MSDAVNSPKHYNEHASGVECIEIAEWLGFNLGNAFKYVWRAGLKADDPVQDLRKALWYVRRESDRRSRAPSALLVPNIPPSAMTQLYFVCSHEADNAAALEAIGLAAAANAAALTDIEQEIERLIVTRKPASNPATSTLETCAPASSQN